MKKTKAILTAAIAAMLAAPVPVLAAENTGADLVNLFYTYSGDNIIGETYDADYLFSDRSLQQKTYDAFLSLTQTDLNRDGVQELLAIRLKPQQNEAGESVNTLLAEVYEYGENKLQRIGQYTLAEDILYQNTARVDVFVTDAQIGRIICCEASDTASLLADGINWSLRAVGFDGAEFYEVTNTSATGSAFEQWQIDEAWTAANSVGISASNIIWNPLMNDVDYMERLCMVERYLITDYTAVNEFFNSGETSMQYGETHFVNLANPGLENKLPKEFAVQIGGGAPQEAAAGAYSYDGDYVIPDSGSRYLTEADLAALSETEILLARNEIYAKHGRIFNNSDLDGYFRSKSWYQPTVAGADFTEDYARRVFNDFEIKNITTIVNYERAHNLNDFG